ncbi:COX assembly mitochondrial protein homolog [Orussus abietinus]|uniref:COX assembly mitochondrial protein homolog n=1 Tax=Orussus abietinus TaxID=222816 RepID=UPI0006259B29|nr:COX assembly mitochondrial protein homolog [Orussus abietinus]
MVENAESQKTYGVLPNRYGGGPHGLGDPDDKSLRKLERDVIITEKMRVKSKKEKCKAEFEAFSECCKNSNLFLAVACRKENADFKTCLRQWFTNEQLREECTQEYLEERSEYRRTGIPKTRYRGRYSRKVEPE